MYILIHFFKYIYVYIHTYTYMYISIYVYTRVIYTWARIVRVRVSQRSKKKISLTISLTSLVVKSGVVRSVTIYNRTDERTGGKVKRYGKTA